VKALITTARCVANIRTVENNRPIIPGDSRSFGDCGRQASDIDINLATPADCSVNLN
jgi:hypothetical protein